ncbi:transposase DDE domain protein [Bacillus clarus]|nr:transposase DDE domain protein [Bacillus clarus]
MVVSKNNMLRQINELVDFSFILEELKTKYCLDNGRNAIPPIRMFKYLLLKAIFNVSDVDLVERSKYDMSFKYFLGMAPEDDVIDSSSLTKFRRLRLQDVSLVDMLIGKTVEIALEKNIIKSKAIIVDATHTKARYNQKSPKEFLQEKSKHTRKAVYQFDKSMKEKFPQKNTSNEVKDEIPYCEKLNVLKEAVDDTQEHLNYSTDVDARVGYKTVHSSFFGYKTHLAISDERIITAAVVTIGEKSDGHYLQELIEKSKVTGMEVETVIADTAYSGKNNLLYTKEQSIQLTSKLNPMITQNGRAKGKGFDFIKDAGLFVCPAGHLAKRKSKKPDSHPGASARMVYFFDVEKCKVCPLREGCFKEGAKTKTYSVAIKSEEHLDQQAFQETEEFKRLARERYKIEAKNSELKNKHGYDQASAAGLLGMQIQGATTIFAVNLKRILKLLDEKG